MQVNMSQTLLNHEPTCGVPTAVAIVCAKLLELDTEVEGLLLFEYLLDGNISFCWSGCIFGKSSLVQECIKCLSSPFSNGSRYVLLSAAGADLVVVVRPQKAGNQNCWRIASGHLSRQVSGSIQITT